MAGPCRRLLRPRPPFGRPRPRLAPLHGGDGGRRAAHRAHRLRGYLRMEAQRIDNDIGEDDVAEPTEAGAGRPRLDVNGIQVCASTLASVSAAAVASIFGVAGTILGAAVVSLVATVGGALYSHGIRHTGAKLQEAQVIPVIGTGRDRDRPGSPLEGVARGAPLGCRGRRRAGLRRLPRGRDGHRARRPPAARQRHRRRLVRQPRRSARSSAAATSRPLRTRRLDRPTPRRRPSTRTPRPNRRRLRRPRRPTSPMAAASRSRRRSRRPPPRQARAADHPVRVPSVRPVRSGAAPAAGARPPRTARSRRSRPAG